MSTAAKWREAHPDLTIEDEALKTMAPFPSLALTDYIHFSNRAGPRPTW